MSRKRVARWICNLILAGCLVGGGYTAAHMVDDLAPAKAPTTPTHETPRTVDVSPRYVKA